MEVIKTAIAGTMESSDIMITMEPGGNGLEIELESTVEKQFGQEIRKVMEEVLRESGVASAKVKAVDKGALDCVIRARLKTAVHRACGIEMYTWGGAEK